MYMTIDHLALYLGFMALTAAALSWLSVRAINKAFDLSMKIDIITFLMLWLIYACVIFWVALGTTG